MKKVFLLSLLLAYISLRGIEIVYPQQLANEFNNIGEIRYNQAKFGQVKYSMLNGRLYHFRKNNDGCRKFDMIDTSFLEDDQVPVFYLHRGGCNFVTKARHAQRAGAELVILADNLVEWLNAIILIDDSTGGDIQIPFVMVAKHIGDLIDDYIVKNVVFNGDIKLIVHLQDEKKVKVRYNLFFNPNHTQMLKFISEFKQFHQSLQNHVQMQPYYETLKCQYCDSKFKIQNCFTNGEYCMTPQGQGKLVLKEEIRQACIFYQITKPNENYKDLRWWDYITNLYKNKCEYTDFGCLELAAGTANIDWKQVDNCYQASFQNKDDSLISSNKILKSQFEFWDTHLKHQAPAITVQDRYFKDGLDTKRLFKEICRQFTDPPKACQ